MKLTDEKVAKALGWLWHEPRKCFLYSDGPSRGSKREVLPFTTSLDAITAEIEARGLWWRIEGARDTQPNPATQYFAYVHTNKEVCQPTAPLALCAALLAYLKETKC